MTTYQRGQNRPRNPLIRAVPIPREEWEEEYLPEAIPAIQEGIIRAAQERDLGGVARQRLRALSRTCCPACGCLILLDENCPGCRALAIERSHTA